jgi:lambda family phage tail tape measure protein
MVDFRIDVVVDPRQAKRGTQQVDRALDKTEKEALDLRKALIDALSARDRGVTRALQGIEATLERTEQQARITQTFIGQIGRDVNAAGVRRVNDELEDTKRKATELGPLLRRAFAGLSIGLAARQFIRFSDQLTNVRNRLRLVTEGEVDLIDTQNELLRVANETRTSFEATSTIFGRLAVSAKELGVTNRQLIDFTQSLNQAIVLSGAASEEARAGLIQLSQGLASGALRGDELRSVLEQLPAVADVIAKGLGVTRGELRLLGQEGKITADIVLDAFKEARGELNERFATTIPTIGQSFTVLGNKVIEAVGAFNDATGVAEGLSRGLLFLSENITAVTIAVGGLSTALIVRFAARAVPAAIAGVAKLNATLILTGPAIAAAAGGLFLLGRSIQRYNDDLREIGTTLRNLEEDAKFISGTASQLTAAQREINSINRAIAAQADRGEQASQAQLDRIEQLQNAIAEARVEIRGQRDDTLAAAAATEQAKIAEQEQADALERQAQILDDLRNPNREFLQFQSDLQALLDQNKISLAEFNALLEASGGAPDAGTATAPEAQQEVANPFEDQLRAIRESNEALAIRAERSGIEEEALLIELGLRRQGIELTREQQDALAGALIEEQNLTEELQRQRDVEREVAEAQRAQAQADARAAQRTERLRNQVDILGQLAEQERELLALRAQELELVPQIDAALENLRLRQLDAANDIASGFERAFIRIGQEAANLAAVGESVVTTFADRATDALVEFARTGQFSFKEFASAVLDDLIRIIARLLIVQAIQSATGLGGAAASVAGSAASNAGRARGGTAQPGQAPFMVGEDGPELFVPNQTGAVIPNAATAGAGQRPQVNVQVVMVEDPDAVPKAIAAGKADEAIVVRAGENRERFQQAIGG